MEEKGNDDDDVFIKNLTASQRQSLRQVFSPDVRDKTKKLLDKAMALRKKEAALASDPTFDDENDFSDFKQESRPKPAKPNTKTKSNKPTKLSTRKTNVKSDNSCGELDPASSEDTFKGETCPKNSSTRGKETLNENAEASVGVERCLKKCHICGEEFPESSFKEHLQCCMKAKFGNHKKGSADGAKPVEKVDCPVCGKELQLFGLMARTEHINKCLDQAENKIDAGDDEEEFSKLLQNARSAIMGCPMCGRKLQTVDSRTRHLKQCAISNHMTVEQVRNLIGQQKEEYHNQLDSGVLPQDFRPPVKQTKLKPTKKPSQYNQDVQLATALSTSMQEFQSQEQFSMPKKSAKSDSGKSSKQCKPKNLLLTLLTKEEATERISNQVASLLFNKSPEDELSKTPSFKNKKKDSHVDSLWSKTSIQIPTEISSSSSSSTSSSSSSSLLKYYVNALMPAVSVSTVVPGSKLRRCSEIPGRGKSFGPSDILGDEATSITRINENSNNHAVSTHPTGHVSTPSCQSAHHLSPSPSPSMVQTQYGDSIHSQTVGILAQLAEENEMNENGDIPSQLDKEEDEFDRAESNEIHDNAMSCDENLSNNCARDQDENSSVENNGLDEFDLVELHRMQNDDDVRVTNENSPSNTERQKGEECEIQDNENEFLSREILSKQSELVKGFKLNDDDGDISFKLNSPSHSERHRVNVSSMTKHSDNDNLLSQFGRNCDQDEIVIKCEVDDNEESLVEGNTQPSLSDDHQLEIDEEMYKYSNRITLDDNSAEGKEESSDNGSKKLLESLSSCLLSLVDNSCLSDVTIKAKDGDTVAAHKNILLARCPVLLAMCFSEESCSVINLSDYSKVSVLWILKYIYGGKMETYPCWKSKNEIMHLARRFHLDPVFRTDERVSDCVFLDNVSNHNDGGVASGSSRDNDVDCEMKSVSAFCLGYILSEVDNRIIRENNAHSESMEGKRAVDCGLGKSSNDLNVCRNKDIEIHNNNERTMATVAEENSNESLELFNSDSDIVGKDDDDNVRVGQFSEQVTTEVICSNNKMADIAENMDADGIVEQANIPENFEADGIVEQANIPENIKDGREFANDAVSHHSTNELLNATDGVDVCNDLEKDTINDVTNIENENAIEAKNTDNISEISHSSIASVDKVNTKECEGSHEKTQDESKHESDIIETIPFESGIENRDASALLSPKLESNKDCTTTTPVPMELTANVTTPSLPRKKGKKVSKKEFNEIIHNVSSKDAIDDEEFTRIVLKLEQVDKRYGQVDVNDSLYIPSVLHDASCLDSGEVEITDAFLPSKIYKKRRRITRKTPESAPKKQKKSLEQSVESTASSKFNFSSIITPDPPQRHEKEPQLNEGYRVIDDEGNAGKSSEIQSDADGPSMNGSCLLFDSGDDLFGSDDESLLPKKILSKTEDKSSNSVVKKHFSEMNNSLSTSSPSVFEKNQGVNLNLQDINCFSRSLLKVNQGSDSGKVLSTIPSKSPTKPLESSLSKPTRPSSTRPKTPSQSQSTRLSPTKSIKPSQSQLTRLSSTKQMRPLEAKTMRPSQSETIRPMESQSTRPSPTKQMRPSEAKAIGPSQSQSTRPSPMKHKRPSEAKMIGLSPAKQMRPSEAKEIRPSPTKQMRPSEAKEIRPSPTKQMRPSEAKEIRPSPTKQMRPSEAKEIRPSPTKQMRPSEAKEIRPSPTKQMMPSEAKEIRPSPTKQMRPSEAKEIRPSPTKQMMPSEAKEIRPYPTKQMMPSEAKEIRPSPTKQLRPSEAREIRPHPTKQVRPSEAREIRPSPTKQLRPSEAREIRPHPTKQMRPSEAREIRPHPTKQMRPSEAKEIRPHPTKEMKPSEAREIRPYPTKQMRPSEAREIRPHPTKQVRPSEAKAIRPFPTKSARQVNPSNAINESSFSSPVPVVKSKAPTESSTTTLKHSFSASSRGADSSSITRGPTNPKTQDSSFNKGQFPTSIEFFTEGMLSCLAQKQVTRQPNSAICSAPSSKEPTSSAIVSRSHQSFSSPLKSTRTKPSQCDQTTSSSKLSSCVSTAVRVSSPPTPKRASFSSSTTPSVGKDSSDLRHESGQSSAAEKTITNKSSSPLSLWERLGLPNPLGPKPKDKSPQKQQANAVPTRAGHEVHPVKMSKVIPTQGKSVNDNTKEDNLKKIYTKTFQERNLGPRQLVQSKAAKENNKIPSPFTPMASYDDMNTPELKKAVGKVGVRPMGKKRMRDILKHIYTETHQYETDSDDGDTPLKRPNSNVPNKEDPKCKQISQKQLFAKSSETKFFQDAPTTSGSTEVSSGDLNYGKRATLEKTKGRVEKGQGFPNPLPSGEQGDMEEDSLSSQDSSFSDGPDVPEESMLQVLPEEEEMEAPCTQLTQTSAEAMNDRLMAFLRDNPKIYEQILMYEALELDVLKKQLTDAGIRIGFPRLQDFLDERCVTFSMKNMNNRNNNKQRLQKRKNGNSPAKGKKVAKDKQKGT